MTESTEPRTSEEEAALCMWEAVRRGRRLVCEGERPCKTPMKPRMIGVTRLLIWTRPR